MKNIFFLFLVGYAIFGCNEKQSKQTQNININSEVFQYSDFVNDSIYFSFINNIESDSSLFEASSLDFSKNSGGNIYAEALIDNYQNIRKLKSVIIDTIQETAHEFYYINGKKRVSSKLISFFQKESEYFHQYISFYDTSGVLVYTGFKTYDDLINAELIPFEKIDSFMAMSDDYAKNIIQQQGDFKTNFRGFVDLDAYNLEFLKVGSNDGNYSSLLAISDENPKIQKLKNNQAKFKGKPLRVEFTKVTRGDGFSYQLLLNVSFNP